MTRWPAAVNLGGADWRMGSVPPAPLWQRNDAAVQEWLAAAVPGNLESDLLALGRIPDPAIGRQNEEDRWVEQHDWWYRRSVHAPLGNRQRAHLVLHGVDYYCAVYGNNVLLGQHEGMFSAQVHDVTDLLRSNAGNLDLAVYLWGAHALPQRQLSRMQRLMEPALRLVSGDTDMFPARIRTTKCQMSFGWDFAPRLPTIGIWDDAEIVISGPVFVANLWVKATPQGDTAQVDVHMLLDSQIAGPAEAVITIHGANFSAGTRSYTMPLELAPGSQTRTLSFQLPSPRLWQPWDRGEPNLYDLTVTILPAGALPSAAATTFGVRSIEMQPLAPAGWALRVNGDTEFLRGVNWVPADILPGRVREGDYARLLAMARAANANMLRVWGGGLREKHSFYEQCDRLGLLIWQEFPFACPNLARYPTDSAFLDLAEQEASAIVQDLRNHPSVVLWCGGNEFGPSKNKPLVERLQKAASGDETRPFLPASPAPGDNHNWMVWHHLAPLSFYVNDRTPIVSEFGLQALPDAASLHAFLPEGAWPPGAVWGYHNAQLGKMRRYAQKFGPLATLDDFVRASQTAQARAVQVMIEHMRRRKGATSGVAVWQLNEPWPSICWSMVSNDGTTKLAYHTLQRVFKPLLVSVEYPAKRYRPGDVVELKLWVVCDGEIPPSPQPSPLQGEGAEPIPSPQRGEGQGEGRSVALLHLFLNGNEVHVQTVHLQRDSSTQVSVVRLRLPENGTPWLLRAELRRGRDLLAENDYDLSYFDAKGIPLLHRLLALFGRWLLR